MTDEQEEPLIVEMEIKLPKILKDPIVLDDGKLLAIGDKVEHRDYGIGVVVRLSCSKKLGNLVYVDFESGKDEIVGAAYLKKVVPKNPQDP